MAKYSRRKSVQEKKDLRKAFVFGILTIGLLVGFIIYGLPTVAKFAAFLTDLRQSNQPIEVNDTTPPAPPKISSPPEVTNEFVLKIEGNAEPGATIKIFANSDEEEVLANKEGTFTYDWELLDGENRVYAKAIDAAGNESQESEVHKVTFDDEPPELTSISPENGKEYFGSRERQVTITGQTEEDARVTINDRVVVVNSEGSFTFLTTLDEGENEFTIKATDRAGNETEENLILYFTP